MTEQFVSVSYDDTGVATIRLDRPKMNALSKAVLIALDEAAQAVRDNRAGAVVIWGGERIFAAGAEISEFGGPAEAAELGGLFHRALNAIAELPMVTIAAVCGYALGGGCELALATDFRVCADNAKLGQPEILLGIIPGGGGTQRLPRLIGSSRAKELIFSGRQVGASEALEIGLVNKVVAPGQVYETALTWARQFAEGPRDALSRAKAAIDGGLDLPSSQGLALELEHFEGVFSTHDAKVGIESFFANGPGKAKFQPRPVD